MAIVKKPNVICRCCGKKYYACKYCLRTQTWRSFCCSEECHIKYTKEILDLREIEQKEKAKTLLSQAEIQEIQSMTPEEALEQTKEDLKDYIEENPDKTLSEIVDAVNEDITTTKKSSRKKSK
jgi:hypothetical protein